MPPKEAAAAPAAAGQGTLHVDVIRQFPGQQQAAFVTHLPTGDSMLLTDLPHDVQLVLCVSPNLFGVMSCVCRTYLSVLARRVLHWQRTVGRALRWLTRARASAQSRRQHHGCRGVVWQAFMPVLPEADHRRRSARCVVIGTQHRCGKIVHYGGAMNTAPLWRHLQAKHPDIRVRLLQEDDGG